MALNKKQQTFVDEFLIDLNATQAAIRAGYSEKTAGQIGDENLKKPEIATAIREAQDARAERTKIDADYVLKRLGDIDQMDALDILDNAGNIRPIKEWPRVWRTTISGLDLHEMLTGDTETIVRKIKWPDKIKNIELIGRHVSVQAWKDTLKLDVTDKVAELIAARKRVESGG